MKQTNKNELIEYVISEGHSIYETIKKQYPSKHWEDLTDAEKQMLLFINDFEAKYRPLHKTDKN